jgi:hypothetical protein
MRGVCFGRALVGTLAVSLAAGGGAAQAGVTSFDLFALDFYRQDSAAPPAAYAYMFSARVLHTGDVTSAQVTQQGPVSPMVMANAGAEWAYSSPVYASRGARDGAFPVGAYVFSLVAGGNGASATRQYPSVARFSPTVPSFTPERYAAMQDVNPAMDLVIDPGFFQVPAGVDYGYTFVLIFAEGGGLVAYASSPPNAGAFTVPGGLLEAGADYTVSVYFSSRVRQNNAGFGGAFSEVAWDVVTDAPLRTRAGCGTSDFDGDGDFGTDADIEAFWRCFAGDCCPACFGADFNGDGDTGTDADIEAFYRVLAGAAC